MISIISLNFNSTRLDFNSFQKALIKKFKKEQLSNKSSFFEYLKDVNFKNKRLFNYFQIIQLHIVHTVIL